MTVNIKKILLAGTAAVAVSAILPSAAKAQDHTLAANATWASAGGSTGANIANADPDESVDLDSYTLTITNDGTANDGSGLNTFNVGDITDGDTGLGGANTGGVTVVTGSANNLTVNFADITVGDFIDISNADGHDATVTVTVDGPAYASGGGLTVTNNETSTADDVNVTFNDSFDSVGNTVVTGGGFAGANTTLTFKGDVDFAFDAGNGANGAATLDDDVGLATLVFSGTAAQAVAGIIDGDAAGEGTISVTNTGGIVTFNDDVGGSNNLLAFTLGAGAEVVAVGELNAATITVNANADLELGDNSTSTDLDVAAGGTVTTTGGTLTATNITLTGTGELEMDGGAVTADVDGNADNKGVLTVTTGGTLTGDIGATNSLNAINVATGQTLLVVGNIDATTTTLTGTGALTITAGNTLTGDIAAAVDGDGTVNISTAAATAAIDGDVGTSSKAVGALTYAAHANATVLTTTGNLYVDAITIGQNDTLSFLGDDAQTVSGTITADGANRGTIVIGDGAGVAPSVTFNGVIGGTTLSALTVNDDAEAIFNANATFAGALSADAATIEVDNGVTLTAATQTDADVTTWDIVVNQVGGGAQTNGTVIFSGDGVNLAVDTVNFDVKAGSAPLTTGASILTDVFQGNAVSVVAGATVTDNSFLYDFALVGAVDNNVDVTITEAHSINDTAATSGNANVGNVLLDDLAASTNADINALQGALQAASSEEELNEVLESVQPTVDGGAVVAAFDVVNTTMGITDERIAMARTGKETGMAAGNVSQGVRMWGQGFGATATQDRRDNIDGFDSDTWGLAVGLDTENMNDNALFGIAFSYADTSVDSKNANQTSSDINSYQFTLYGNYDIDPRTYLSGQFAYTWSEVDTLRQDLGGIAGNDASGNYDADQFSARAEVGRDYSYETATVTPHAMANWMHYSPDSYTETGAGGANLNVDGDSVNVFELGVGADVGWMLQQANGGYLAPEIRVGYRYDLAGDAVETTSSFVGGGPAFKSEGFDPARSAFDLGAGLTYFSADSWELSADYNFTFKSDYDNHSGFLRAAYKF